MTSRIYGDLTRRSLMAGALAVPIMVSSSPARAATAASPAGIAVQRLAWAGIRLELGDAAVFIDARAPDPENGAPGPALSSAAARKFALITHHHLDHYDPEALKAVLGERGYVVAHEEAVRMFSNRSVNVQPVRLHEPAFLSRANGEFVARCVPASDGLGSPQVSWIVDGGGRKIIHCGDTQWHGGWWDIARAYGPFDAAFLPINGLRQTVGRYQDVAEPMGMTGEQAVSAAKILKPGVVIPIHYGNSTDPTYVEEPDAIGKFLKAAAAQGVRTRVMQPGETFIL
jgi:L-ascorbate metabolism protein UlaG (beta-lactamase superfamily)